MDFGFTGQAGFAEVVATDNTRRDKYHHHQQQHHHHHHSYKQKTAAFQDDQKPPFYPTNSASTPTCDIKPRLTKEQHDVLEAHFLKHSKPSTNTKKGFADSLNVSLDKVNNWFQNRRAKLKQDAKKTAGAVNLFPTQQSQVQNASQLGFSSDSDSSPAFVSADYFAMMQHCSDADQVPNGMPRFSHQQNISHSAPPGDSSYSADNAGPPQYTFDHQQAVQAHGFDSPEELQRRTLTQEQFDAFAHDGGDAQNFGNFNGGFSDEMMSQMFPGYQNGDFKQLNSYAFPVSANASMPTPESIQSSVNGYMQSNNWDNSNMPPPSSEWIDSRSSSVSVTHQGDPFVQASPAQQDPAATTSQWQPGQSVPVDFDALSQEFRQVSQGRQPTATQPQVQDQPPVWPSEEAYARRDSSASMLAQQMSHVGIHTPQPQQSATFKAPAPPSSIAARRQRPRPAALGLASLRSQSYSGAAQPASPSQNPQGSLAPGQPLRRIRSSNVITGVTQGRVQKQNPGAAQRSPLAWTFADSVTSPKAARFASSSSQGSNNLAPPTPLSPHDGPQWQMSGRGSRQPSISETDAEYCEPFDGSMPPPPQNFSSPPHTPLYHQQQFFQRIGNNVITENTPPQSAPASQTCFPASVYSQPKPQMQPLPQRQPVAAPQKSYAFEQEYSQGMAPDMAFQMPNRDHEYAADDMSSAYAGGVPIVNAQGQLTLAFPQQVQFMPQHQQQQQPQQQQPKQRSTSRPSMPPPAGSFGQFSVSPSPVPQAASQPPKPVTPAPPTELLIHEYSPPEGMKSTMAPRVSEPSGPKNFTFSNHGAEYFEERGKRSGATSSANNSSPASSTDISA